MLTDELRYHLLKALEHNPNLSQRQLAKELHILIYRERSFSSTVNTIITLA